jgi:hypothetical protein
MAKQCESQFTREIRKALEARCGCRVWVKKIVGNGMMQVGIPDLVGVLDRVFIGVEDKALQRSSTMGKTRRPFAKHGLFTPDQVENLIGIEKAGGMGIGLLYVKDEDFAVIVPADMAETAKEWTIAGLMAYSMEHPELVLKDRGSRQGGWDVEPLIAYTRMYRQGNGTFDK